MGKAADSGSGVAGTAAREGTTEWAAAAAAAAHVQQHGGSSSQGSVPAPPGMLLSSPMHPSSASAPPPPPLDSSSSSRASPAVQSEVAERKLPSISSVPVPPLRRAPAVDALDALQPHDMTLPSLRERATLALRAAAAAGEASQR
jgi:hypothetical protein